LLCSVQLLLGHVKLQLAKFAEADALFQASRTTRVELYTVDSIQAAEATEALGICAKKQAKYADADAETDIIEAIKNLWFDKPYNVRLQAIKHLGRLPYNQPAVIALRQIAKEKNRTA
jgi:hypothetical protein